ITNPNNQAANGGVSVLQVSISNFDDIGRTPFGSQGAAANRSHLQWFDSDQDSGYATNGSNTAASDAIFNWVEYPETSIKSTSYNS
ncbi:hypothetical protein HOL63_04145, partial [Candidatus Peregrinibacteria bacterium]|nr:hypothetical protein [Candidatus Peregrinibacteria bacterium]